MRLFLFLALMVAAFAHEQCDGETCSDESAPAQLAAGLSETELGDDEDGLHKVSKAEQARMTGQAMNRMMARLAGAGSPKGMPIAEKTKLAKRVKRFYAQYLPEKLGDTPQAAEAFAAGVVMKWAGEEDSLMPALVDKYGPEPTSDGDDGTEAHAPYVAPGDKLFTAEELAMYGLRMGVRAA